MNGPEHYRKRQSSVTANGLRFGALLAAVAAIAGCQSEETEKLVKKPRPVEVRTLARTGVQGSAMVTAPVGSWKTEQIGFEVNGRIESVVEPNTEIEGRVVSKDGEELIKGTPVARIDPERYELQVKSQQAQVLRAKEAISAAKTRLEKTLPAQLRAADAELKRAKVNFERSKSLAAQNAGSKADVDRDDAAYNTALEQIEQLKASRTGQEAELRSLEAQLLQANDSLRNAKRDRDNCTLYSSFRGQIAEISVVPGSIVTAGAPVARVQMMDPIKIEVEVSAEDSRRLRNRQRIPIWVTREDRTEEEKDGYLYLIDPVADPQTRTFTLTLLVINERLADEAEALGIPSVEQAWRVDFEFLPGAKEGTYFAVEDAICQDNEGHYVWHITNMVVRGDLPADRILKLRKVRVKPGPSQIPFLGNWVFQEIILLDDEFDPKKHVIAGELKMGSKVASDWEGDKVLFQNAAQWMLRPGDLVKVNLADNAESSGLYVPVDALAYELERTFLFLLNEGASTVERVEVSVDESALLSSSVVSVSALESSVPLEGRKYVSRGAHFLVDGEKVRPVESGDDQ